MISENLIGLIPAAGFASRLSTLPCSKEIFPVGFTSEYDFQPRIKVVSENLLHQFKQAGVHTAHMVVRKDKWDIPQYYGTGDRMGMNLSYIIADQTRSTPHSVSLACPFLTDKTVLFGFPDIISSEHSVYSALLKKLSESDSGLVLGLYRASDPGKVDMVKFDENGRVKQLIIKPRQTKLIYTWLHAVWEKPFTEHLFNRTQHFSGSDNDLQTVEERYMGDIINSYIREGYPVETVIFKDATYVDIGTFPDLARAVDFSI